MDSSLDAMSASLDVVVIGAGFSGLYALYKMRALGLRVRSFEAGDGVGGTWAWNRYPGARCDIESVEYSYSFSKELESEWVWTESMAAQPEIERYLNFVADRFDLRRHISFATRITSLSFDEAADRWTVETDRGERYSAQFVIAATGLLSVPLDPVIAGMDKFTGTSLFSNRFPREGFDFTGKRVALIGTGSSGVQAVPVLAERATHLYVFQRSAAYTLPSDARPYEAGELDVLKADYPAIRAAQRVAVAGTARNSAFNAIARTTDRPALKTASREEQLRCIAEFGVGGALYWSDIASDMEANEIARLLYGEAIANIVKDPETAASLTPSYPFGCKRPIIDNGYYAAFNRDNVTLVDLQKAPLETVTENGIRTQQGFFEVDVILYATGFDALTGALNRIDISGRNGVLLRDKWEAEGPGTYLGLQMAGFPNLFSVLGPGSPGALANVAVSMEIQIDWITDCIAHLRDQGLQAIEADAAAETQWVHHMNSLVENSVVLHPSCTSWWIGTNIPGKKRVFMSYAAGIPEYRRHCQEAAAAGYRGFALT